MAKRPIKTDTKERSAEGLPGAFADTTPHFGVAPDHNFTLQMIMELQKSNGQLTESVRHITTELEKIDAKLEEVKGTLSGVTHKMYAAGAVLAVLIAIGGFIVKIAWDLALDDVKKAIHDEPVASQPAAPQPVAPQRQKNKP